MARSWWCTDCLPGVRIDDFVLPDDDGGIYAFIGPDVHGDVELGTVTPKNRLPARCCRLPASAQAWRRASTSSTTSRAAALSSRRSPGTTATLAQPLAAQTYPASAVLYPTPAEDDTWAAGQSVSVYSLPLYNMNGYGAQGGQAARAAGELGLMGAVHTHPRCFRRDRQQHLHVAHVGTEYPLRRLRPGALRDDESRAERGRERVLHQLRPGGRQPTKLRSAARWV